MFSKKSGLIFLFIGLTINLIAGRAWLNEKNVKGVPSEQLSLTGMVTVDGKPVSSEIQINSLLKNDKSFVKIHASKSNGLFTINLPLGDVYEIIVEVNNFPPQIIELSTVNVDSTLSLNAYADFTSPEYDKKLEELIKTNTEKVRADNFDKHGFELRYGNSTKSNLSYKVQIGAFRFYENFNYNSVIGMPKIIRQTDDDLITRFTMGNFNSYNQAKELLTRLQKNKLQDAFIIAIYNGEKKFLHQLVKERILE